MGSAGDRPVYVPLGDYQYTLGQNLFTACRHCHHTAGEGKREDTLEELSIVFQVII